MMKLLILAVSFLVSFGAFAEVCFCYDFKFDSKKNACKVFIGKRVHESAMLSCYDSDKVIRACKKADMFLFRSEAKEECEDYYGI